uniref:ATP synthase complex subunit 8 n=1 Tax=Quercophylus gonoporospinus TaxID=2127011 RepID=A0A514LND3_9HEMI|nr:ATP synthase F0 subunit 8 [Quercophylus gonoporospinus]
MPQMAPMWWYTLFMMFILTYCIFMMFIYFYKIYKMKMDKIYENPKNKNMNWKW